MALTPEEVVSKTFQATKFREGYDQDEVDDFLDEVVNTLRALQQENEELKTKLSACESRVGELSRAGAAAAAAPVLSKPEPVAAPKPMPEPEPVKAQPAVAPAAAAVVQSAPAPGGPEQATGMLALAQKLHDEHVRSGVQKRDQLVSEAREQSERLVREAEAKKSQTLGALEQERSLLERKIDELRGFEREYRTRLKSYLETQLKDLEAKGSMVPAKTADAGGSIGS
jgi:DivIVA domain-containing protein